MEKEYCYDCMHTHHYYEQGLSLWNHKAPVNQSIYQFKYHNQRRYGELYSQELVKNFQKEIRRWNPDVIIPVPLHRRDVETGGVVSTHGGPGCFGIVAFSE